MNHSTLTKRTAAVALILALAATWLTFGGCREAKPDLPARVAAAISLKEVMEALATAFEQTSGQKVELVFGSSGQLAGQIRNGAPIDLFVSAAHKQIDELAGAGLVDKSSVCVIAGNALVLIVPADAADAPVGFAELSGVNVRRLAMGEPTTVPAGLYAQQVLAKLGLLDALAGRVVYATNVRQVLSYVERGEVSAGIVYRTDARAAGDKVRQVAVADAAWHEPIEYPAVVVSKSDRRAPAEAFVKYLGSGEARRILKARGFKVHADGPTISGEDAGNATHAATQPGR